MITLVENIREALANELDMYLDIKVVFQDKDDIGPGNRVRETISIGLCESVVMILLYTPKYFSPMKLFCSSELEGMLRLEDKRTKKSSFPKTSMVIPIMLRGSVSDLPHDLQNRNPVDFTGLSMASPDVMRNPENMLKIRGVAEKIHTLFQKLESTGKSFCEDCAGFLILDENDSNDRKRIEAFVKQYKGPSWKPEFVIS